MKIRTFTPHYLLQPYISNYMLCTVGQDNDMMDLDLFPVGHGVLAFILDETHFIYNNVLNKQYDVRFNFTGQLNHYHHIRTSSSSMVYVVFKPFGAYKVLGIPQYLFLNECIALGDVIGKSVQEVLPSLEDHAHCPENIIPIMEKWLLRQLAIHDKISVGKIAQVCDEINQYNGNLPVKILCRNVGMSKSSLEQYFKEQVGLSPKMYSRVIRFNQVNQFLVQHGKKDWQELVYRYGYFDQAHFIHEFKHFFGKTPSQIHLGHQNLAQQISSFEV